MSTVVLGEVELPSGIMVILDPGLGRFWSLDARAAVAARRISHFERAHSALVAGDGLGVVQYNGMWGVVVGRLPTGRRLPVIGYEMDDDEFAGRFRTIDIIADATATVAHSR